MRSRSRRDEYAQKFEEVTKQEIKNYNDSLLETHMALAGFRESLKDSIDQYAQQMASLSSTIKRVEAENVDLKKTVGVLSKKVEDQRNDFNKIEREKIEGDKKNTKFHKRLEDEIVVQHNSIFNVKDVVFQESLALNLSLNEIKMNVDFSYRKTQADNAKLKEEILSLPSEAEQVKEELLKKLEISAIDNAGLTKEIEKIKKKAFIQEKMNEYFQTQVDRLKTPKD